MILSNSLIVKLPGYLNRLAFTYQHASNHLFADLLNACRWHIIEQAEYDNWNGGTYGHEVVLFLPLNTISRIGLDQLAGVRDGLKNDLNKLADGVANEYYSQVRLEVNDSADDEFKQSTALTKRVSVDPATVEFWKADHIRAFISHRDAHKSAARELGTELDDYGISCFVAHDTIKPLSEWRHEILRGLETMEVMIVFLTDDFDDSLWCQQEVGYALGKGVPILPLKLGKKDPSGFTSHIQALKGRPEELSDAAQRLFKLIGDALGKPDRISDSVVNAFCQSKDFDQARDRFTRMERLVAHLSNKQLNYVIASYFKNDQLHRSIYLNNKYNRLKNFLESATGRVFSVSGREISEVAAPKLVAVTKSF